MHILINNNNYTGWTKYRVRTIQVSQRSGLQWYVCAHQKDTTPCNFKQEGQLMLTNSRDAVRGQLRSPNIVPFHISGIVSY